VKSSAGDLYVYIGDKEREWEIGNEGMRIDVTNLSASGKKESISLTPPSSLGNG
jgi:hypothetical protein